MEKSPLFKILVQNHNRKHKKYRFLAKSKIQRRLLLIAYIPKSTKKQKKANPLKKICPFIIFFYLIYLLTLLYGA